MESKDVYGDNRFFSHKEGEIVIWTRNELFGPVESAWIRVGQMGVPNVRDAPFTEVLTKCKMLVNQRLVPCIDCGTLMPIGQIGGNHFAGWYCKDCWKKYQKENSRICRICRQPIWRCCC